jgi:probable F420-dependent oxidoreductase
MKIGLYLRNMGPASAPATLLACARAAEAAGIEDLWVADHIAIPPDQAEGSGGRYLDPLATLAFLAGATRRIGLATGVLVLPYRPPLATAKWVATIQELSQGRLRLGVGVGWMEPEFRASGADPRRRGRVSDEILEFLALAFSRDEVDLNGQTFLFLPRPPRPPLYFGGGPAHALRRAVRFGGSWMPMSGDLATLQTALATWREGAEELAQAAPPAVPILLLADHDEAALRDELAALAALGVEHVVYTRRYSEAREFAAMVDLVTAARGA